MYSSPRSQPKGLTNMKMEDKVAAYLFGVFFEEMAKHSHLPGMKESARKVYEDSLDFDIEDSDMDCDAALLKLGLKEENNEKLEYPAVEVVPDSLLKCG